VFLLKEYKIYTRAPVKPKKAHPGVPDCHLEFSEDIDRPFPIQLTAYAANTFLANKQPLAHLLPGVFQSALFWEGKRSPWLGFGGIR
jgi:hypothetical protein